MYKFVVLYFAPKDPEHFKKYYREVHVPKGGHPLIKRRWYTFDVNSVNTQVLPVPSNVFCYYEAEFENDASFLECARDPVSIAAAADTEHFATGGLLALHFQVP